MSDLVEFRHLKYIAAIAETANFTRAAERLFLAQPSLSKQIKDLEDGIGIQIFVRHHDGVRLTAAGQMVVSYAQEAVKTRNEIILAARAVHCGEIPALRIGFDMLHSGTPPYYWAGFELVGEPSGSLFNEAGTSNSFRSSR